MPSPITVTNVEVLDNPSFFKNPFQFQITFECAPPGVKEDLEWKLIYVGSADDDSYDQVLDSVLVGPVQIGCNKFVFQANAPDSSRIPATDLLEVTVVLLIGSYRDREFIRVGYYVNNSYGPDHPEWQLAPPAVPVVERVHREILADKPRVTRLEIPWDDEQHEARLLAEKEAADAQEPDQDMDVLEIDDANDANDNNEANEEDDSDDSKESMDDDMAVAPVVS